MANVNEKFGLRPYRSLNGAPWNNAQNRYTIANNLSTAIFQGDPVKPTTEGNCYMRSSNSVADTSPAINFSNPTCLPVESLV